MYDRSTEKWPRTCSRAITYGSDEAVTPTKKVLTVPCEGKTMNNPNVYVYTKMGKTIIVVWTVRLRAWASFAPDPTATHGSQSIS